jgi:hypothetical protein
MCDNGVWNSCGRVPDTVFAQTLSGKDIGVLPRGAARLLRIILGRVCHLTARRLDVAVDRGNDDHHGTPRALCRFPNPFLCTPEGPDAAVGPPRVKPGAGPAGREIHLYRAAVARPLAHFPRAPASSAQVPRREGPACGGRLANPDSPGEEARPVEALSPLGTRRREHDRATGAPARTGRGRRRGPFPPPAAGGRRAEGLGGTRGRQLRAGPLPAPARALRRAAAGRGARPARRLGRADLVDGAGEDARGPAGRRGPGRDRRGAAVRRAAVAAERPRVATPGIVGRGPGTGGPLGHAPRRTACERCRRGPRAGQPAGGPAVGGGAGQRPRAG